MANIDGKNIEILSNFETEDQNVKLNKTLNINDGFEGNGLKEGLLFKVNSNFGIPILQVNASGYILEQSNKVVGIYESSVLFEFNKVDGDAAFITYYLSNPVTRAFRAGVITSVWDSTNDLITYTEDKTTDITGTTSGITLTPVISGTNVQVLTTITEGRWDVKLGVKLL